MSTHNSPLKIAHRGASGYEAENSLAALKKAIDLDADIVEADVQLTKDGVPIIRHDTLLDRTTTGTGFVRNRLWSEFVPGYRLPAIDSRLPDACIRLKNGAPVPSLDRFCATLAPHRQHLYLDVKCLDAEHVIIETALKHLPAERLLIGSFHHGILPTVKKINPVIRTIMIIEGAPVSFKPLIDACGCDIVGVGYEAIEQRGVNEIHELGKKVFTWTVNHPLEIEHAKSMGVDGITGDFPDRL